MLPAIMVSDMSLVYTSRSLAAESLAAQLGPFGVPHADERDSPAGLTAMICNSDLDDDILPGYFMIGELGIAVGKDTILTITHMN